jgi:hypothetical protein
MLLNNHTTTELINLASTGSNDLALEIANRLESDLEESTEELKTFAVEMVESKIEQAVERHLEEFKAEGMEFNNLAECYSHCVQDSIEHADINQFTEHLEHHMSETRWHYPAVSEAFKHVYWRISEDVADLYAKFTDDQMKELREKALSEFDSAFDENAEHCMGIKTNYCIYYVAFGETLFCNLSDLGIELPEHITTDDLNAGNCHICDDGDILASQEYDGIGWTINLEWLEGAIVEIVEDSE